MTWTQTYTGKRFDPLDPDPAMIDLADIAHALSNVCRFGGHSQHFYSVAQHSVFVADYLFEIYDDRKIALAGLLHDASEAYLGDIPRPLKYRPEFAAYREAEATLEAMIFERFGLKGPYPEVKKADNAILADEAKWLMGNPGAEWGLTEPALGLQFSDFLIWAPGYWRAAFVDRARRYGVLG